MGTTNQVYTDRLDETKSFVCKQASNNGIFLGEMHRHMSHEEEQKNFFCCSQVVLAWGLFEGFFWPEEGRRPSEGQKNPENSPKAKTSLAKAKQVFLFFQMMKNVVHWP